MRRKHSKKTACRNLKAISLALMLTASYTVPAYAALALTEATPDDVNVNVLYPSGYTINPGATRTSYATSTQTAGGYVSVILGEGSIWRPLDSSALAVSNLTMNSGSTIDLAYKYSADNGYTETNVPAGRTFWEIGATSSSRQPSRKLTITNGQFGDDLTFRVNLGTKYSEMRADGTYKAAVGYSDSIILSNPALLDTDPDAKVNVNVEYVLNKNFAAGKDTSFSWANQTAAILSNKVDQVFSISTSTPEIIEKFNVSGTSINQVDGALNKYIITTELLHDPYNTVADTQNKKWSVFWEATRQDYLSQGAYSAANAALATRNLWRIEDGLFWKRGDDRRFEGRSIAQDDFSQRESVWANTWRGEYTFDGIQDSTFGQKYSGIQVGYDKLRDRELLGGKVYTGLFLSQMSSDANFNAQNAGGADYNSGLGDLDSTGIGAYMLWVGNNGRYLDTAIRWSKIENKYTYTDSFGDSFRKDFTGKTYGIGARYGQRINKDNGWFIEPQVGLSYGVLRSLDFRMENDLRYSQKDMEMLIGRAGLTIGKEFGPADKRGQAYLKLAANHDFMDGGDAMFYAMQPGSNAVAASQKVDTLAGKDTWYDVTLGSNFQLNENTNAWMEVNKSFSGKVNTDWQINGGLSWRWGGPSKVKQAEAVSTALASPFMHTSATSTTDEGTADKGENTQLPAVTGFAQQGNIAVIDQNSSAAENSSTADSIASAEPSTAGNVNSSSATVVLPQSNTGEYTLAPLVVEAARPDWEKKLSPGTVSVIEVPKYDGEQKTLADMLQTVPGVYIDRLTGGGTGHYTTVRIRGSSASQVNIYMDGVLVNTGSEQAVNLENLNMDNVERIEVYRGYIPARFAGAAMGGAINIVTKRPDKTGGKVSYGMRSFGGQKFNLETTAPLGEGSLLFAVNREEATGDFKYTRTEHEYHSYVPPGGSSDDAIRTDYPDTRWRQYNGYENNNILAKWQDDNWFVKLNYINNKTHRPQTVGSYLADVPEQYWPDRFSDASRAVRGGTVDTEKTELSFGRRQETGNVEWGWKLGTVHQDKQALWARYANGNRDLAFGTNTFRNDTYNASIDGTWKMGETHLVEFLATASKETMKVKFAANEFYSSQWGKKFEQYFLPKYDMSNYYLQIQDTMRLDSKGSLTFTPLWRAQKSEIGIDVNEGGGWLYSYNLGLKKQFNDQWTVRATYGTYHKVPSWYEIFGDGVNLVSKWHSYNSVSSWSPETYAEHGQNWDISVNRNGKLFGTDNDTTLTYFNRKSENLLTTVFNPLTGATWYANYGAGKIQGIELSNKMSWKRYDFTLSTTWQDSLVTKGYKAYMNMSNAAWDGQPFPWTPEWTVNARLDYRFPGDKLSVFGEYNWIDKLVWYNQQDYGGNEAMGLFNIGMKYRFDNKFNLVAGINDIANKGPEQMMASTSTTDKMNVAYPQQGRTYYMTVEYSF